MTDQGPEWMFCTRDLVVQTVEQSKTPKAIRTGTGAPVTGPKKVARVVRRTSRRR